MLLYLSLLCRNEHDRLADIFVKKGPYLKMYSTYIREFDKNVALLDEQSKKNSAFAGLVREFEVTRPTSFLSVWHCLMGVFSRLYFVFLFENLSFVILWFWYVTLYLFVRYMF